MKVKMYTDGACSGNPGPGGWAVVVNTSNECKRYCGGEPVTTNNRMELTAVIHCLEIILDTKDKSVQFEIYSDSAYVVNAINNGWIECWNDSGWKTKQNDQVKNQDLWKRAYEYIKKIRESGQNVAIVKIKGHSGNTFNELCDKLAKDAIKMA